MTDREEDQQGCVAVSPQVKVNLTSRFQLFDLAQLKQDQDSMEADRELKT